MAAEVLHHLELSQQSAIRQYLGPALRKTNLHSQNRILLYMWALPVSGEKRGNRPLSTPYSVLETQRVRALEIILPLCYWQ
jgi:hypothetical protein